MKRIISLILILTALFSLVAVTVSAAEEEFISEVALVYEDSVEEARKAIEGTDWKLFEYDLNANADYWFDDGVYLVYKTTTNVEDAITDLRVMDMYGGYKTSNYEEELKNSRDEYDKMIDYLCIVAAEFKARYMAGDEMAKLAYRQMNYYQDVKTDGGDETGAKMGDFFLNMPTSTQIVQVMFEGNSVIVSGLINLLAIGISGENESETLAGKVAEMYAVKDTLTDAEYYDKAVFLSGELSKVRAKLLRYDSLCAEYGLDDEDMSEEEFSFLTDYASVALLIDDFMIGSTGLADLIRANNYTMQDIYPLVAALTDGQMALIKMGQLETVLKYNAPSKPIEELNAILDEFEKEYKDGSGVFTPYDVYLGVDRSIFNGTFAMTDAAKRQQSLTGETWGIDDATSRSTGATIGYIAASVLDVSILGFSAGLQIKYHVMLTAARAFGRNKAAVGAFASKWAPVAKVGYGVSVAMALVILGCYAISSWYNYYNPDYTPIPDTMVDVRETDVGDKYIKYTAAKVFGDDGKKNADFNAYEGKEWNALYYTKDATAGNCLKPNFVVKENDNSVARRHQGISMFGEDNAYDLNSHVYDKDAKSIYVTVRYSTAKKAAADIPPVIGSMFATGAVYALTAIAGVGAGIGATILVQNSKKKKESGAAVATDSAPTES